MPALLKVRAGVRLLQAEFSVKLVDTTARINQLLLACIKWVTLRADFHLDIRLCAPCFNNLSASAPNRRLLIVRMESFLHHVHLFFGNLRSSATRMLTHYAGKCNSFVMFLRYFRHKTRQKGRRTQSRALFRALFSLLFSQAPLNMTQSAACMTRPWPTLYPP